MTAEAVTEARAVPAPPARARRPLGSRLAEIAGKIKREAFLLGGDAVSVPAPAAPES